MSKAGPPPQANREKPGKYQDQGQAIAGRTRSVTRSDISKFLSSPLLTCGFAAEIGVETCRGGRGR
jgi:hypothetical protein